MTLTTGNLKLNAGNITFIGAGQIVGETNTKRIYGTSGELITTVTLNAPNNVNPAQLGATITSTANLGSTTLKRGHTIYSSTGSSLARYYDINPTTNTGLNATLQFYYHDSELNGNTEAALKLWRSPNAGANWTIQSNTTVNTVDNFLTLSSIEAFSRWTAAAAGALPIELLDFSVKNRKVHENHLTWRTANEKNNSHFDIERSSDGIRFEKIAFVKGAGTTNVTQQYTYTDASVQSAVTYYRLKQVDTDGQFKYSKVVSVESKGDGLKVYPTLVSEGVLTVQGGQSDDFIVTNLVGQTVLSGKTSAQIHVSNLAKGTYLLKIGSEVAKFVKQ